MQHRAGLYWFKLGEGDDVEWVIGRLLQSKLVESHDGQRLPYRDIRAITGPIPRAHFRKANMSSRRLLHAERETNPLREVSGGQP